MRPKPEESKIPNELKDRGYEIGYEREAGNWSNGVSVVLFNKKIENCQIMIARQTNIHDEYWYACGYAGHDEPLNQKTLKETMENSPPATLDQLLKNIDYMEREFPEVFKK